MLTRLSAAIARTSGVRFYCSAVQTGRSRTTGRTLDDKVDQQPLKFMNLEDVEFKQPAFQNEELETKRKRLMYQSTKRGMLEMDNLFGAYAFAYLAKMDGEQLSGYDAVLRENDPDLYKWLVKGVESPPEEVAQSAVYQDIVRFVASGELKEVRDFLIGQ